MAMSTADYFRMMQGGVDRTGYADMIPDVEKKEESPEDRLAKLIAQNEAEEPGDEELGGDISEEDELSIMQSLFGDDEGSFTSDEAVGQNALLAASFPAVGAAYKGGQKLIEPIAGKVTKESIEKAAETAGGKGFMKYFARRAPAMLAKRGALAATGAGFIPAAISLIPEAAYMYADYNYPDQVDAFEKKIGGGIKAGAETVGSGLQSGVDYLQSFMPESDYVDDRTEEEKAYHEAIGSYYNPYRETNNEGGRVNRFKGGMSDAQRKSGGSTHSGGPSQGPDNNKNDLMGPGLDAPTIDPMKAVGYTPMKQPSLIDQVKKYNFLQGVYGDEDDGLSFGYDINPYAEEASAKLSYSFADGGRVGLQNGGNAAPISNFNQPNPNPLPPATQGLEPGSNAFKAAMQGAAVSANSRLGNLVSSAVQAMPQQPMGAQPMGAAGQPSSVYGLGSLLSGMQQSMGPTFRTADFRDSNNDGVDDRDQGMGISPSIPGDESNPGMNIEEILASLQSGMPQAYTPYVSTMPLYDPSTLGTGLPSTAGGYDPYVSYDPYAPVGAFSRPPSNMDTPSFGLTEDQIKEGFSDMDRFSLAAQQAKKKAEAEAKKATQRRPVDRGPESGEGPSLG